MFYFERPKITEVFEYRRQSLDEKDVRQTHSLPLQSQFNAEFAERFGLKIVDTFIDDASAKTPNNRPQFTAMLKELQVKNPALRRAEGILAWHPDRLSRNGLEAGQLVQMLVDEQIKDMFFPTYHFHNDPSGIEHLMMEFGRAISYSGWLSINSKRGSTGREQQGAWVYGRSKFGYTKLREFPEQPKRCSLFPIPNEKTFPARKRLVELWLKGLSDEACSEVLKREFGLTVKRPTISVIRKDKFNFGVYVIKEGTKDEREIDFRELTAPDGRKFEPVTDEATYWKFQSRQVREQRPLRTKHLNPLSRLVTCGCCGEKMRPARRKIHRAGGEKIQQLGYECQTPGCKGRRTKAEVIYKHVGLLIAEHFGALDKRHYHQYVAGLHSFIAEQSKTSKVEKGRLTRRLQKLEAERGEVIERRLAAIQAYEYDEDIKTWCADRLKVLDKEISALKEQRQELAGDTKGQVRSFKEFIELRENLHRLWLLADEAQKQTLSSNLLLNLEIKDQGVRSLTWSHAFAGLRPMGEFQNGGAIRQCLEPYFTLMWRGLVNKQGVFDLQDLSQVLHEVKSQHESQNWFALPSDLSTS